MLHLLLACSALLPGAIEEPPPHAFVGARLITMAGDDVADGVLVVEGGRIAAVGPRAGTPIPPNAVVHDLAGRTVMPGLVDTHSHVGQVEGGDGSAALHPEVRALDAIDVRDASIQRAQAGGLTTANIMPGSGLLMSGQTVYVKLRDGRTIDDLALVDAEGRALGGMKMANGTNPRGAPPLPGSRAKAAALVREKFVAADNYRAKLARAGADPAKRPDRDLGLEALVDVLEGRRVVHHHTHRHDDVLTVLRLKQEFGFQVVLHHVSDAWMVADEIARAGVPVSLILVDSPGGKLEAKNLSWQSAPALERAGVLVGFHTDDAITDSRLFLRSAGLAVRAGMTRRGALAALTISGARMLGLEARIGSLEPGKDADFAVLSGDPLSVYTRVEETWIDGVRVFDRADPKDALYADGGAGAGDARDFHGCCFGGEDGDDR